MLISILHSSDDLLMNHFEQIFLLQKKFSKWKNRNSFIVFENEFQPVSPIDIELKEINYADIEAIQY